MKRETRAKLSSLTQGVALRSKKRGGLLVPVLCTVVTVVLLLTLGLAQYELRGYLAQDGFAVPADTLNRRLSTSEEAGEAVALVPLTMGESVFSYGLGGKNYYIGDDKEAISSGYPMFLQSGQVLHFLDDSLKLVTDDWDVLNTYDGLYLSDGVTFNADRGQADIETVLLVQVDGGYQLGQSAALTGSAYETGIPMNAICAFSKTEIVYFTYENGTLMQNHIRVDSSDTIAIGDMESDYETFLKNLGLWEEAVAQPAAQEETPEEPETLSEEEDAPQPPKGQNDQVSTEVPQAGEKPEKPEKVPSEPQAPSTEIPEAGPAIENPNSTPSEGGSVAPAPDPNPGYQEPTVAFGETITPWVYTLSVQATVSDPSEALKGGVQIYVYQVSDSGEKQALRKVISSSGDVALGQLAPDTQYHIIVKYTYYDKLNYPKTVELDLGNAATLAFSELGSIGVSFYDEHTQPANATAVGIFSQQLQLRNLVLSNVSNGSITKVGDVITHPSTNAYKAETYINQATLSVTNTDTQSVTTIKMDAAALRLLREGFTLSQWETDSKLASGSSYTYTLEMSDRYGNLMELTGVTGGAGHTCKNPPTVTILVPDRYNVSGSARFNVTWENKDNAAVAANPAFDAAMGGDTVAGLFLVRQGEETIPENAVTLNAYLADDETTALTGVKFLPVTVNSDGTVTSVTTSWVITNLEVLKGYTAAVLCGHYDIEDGLEHDDWTLDDTVNFVTASLANLGTVSYTSEVSNITPTTAEVSFRMNKADSRLLPLLDTVTLTIAGGDESQTVTVLRSDLQNVPISLTDDGSWGDEVEIPVYLNGEASACTATLGLSGVIVPALTEGDVPDNVWDYLLATSATTAADGCYLTVKLGGDLTVAEGELKRTLLTLQPKTDYVGTFTTLANQGGESHDVSNGSGQKVMFTTASEEATVNFANIFVSSSFVELYALSITDGDRCILEDSSDRGGANVLIKILDAGGVTVASRYINSAEEYDSLRLTGLEKNATYTMVFYALKYRVNSTTELNRPLQYGNPQPGSALTEYVFTTGQSVDGDLTLEGVSQLYQEEDGSSTDTLSLLTADDIYTGVLQQGSTLYYYATHIGDTSMENSSATDVTYREQYLSEVAGRESGSDDEETARLASLAKGEAGNNSLNLVANSSSYMSNVWTTRILPVIPGEKYVIYNTEASGYFRITYYYEAADGSLRCYGLWSTRDDYMRGGVFQVPTVASSGNANADRICYMRIAGYNQRDCDGMILERYDSSRCAATADLTEGVSFVEGMVLSTSNTPTFSASYAYTADYIPVTSGSIYQMQGRDPNINEEAALNNLNSSNGRVLFYDASYAFLGSYTLCNQTALIKAPFGAAYCRFNVVMDQAGGEVTLNTNKLEMHLYKAAIADSYLVTLQAELEDLSASDKQVLVGGTYTVTLYTSTTTVSDSDDPGTQSYLQLGQPQAFAVTETDLNDKGELHIEQQMQFTNLNPNMAFKATLEIQPAGWESSRVLMDTVYFTTNRVVRVISNLAGLLAIRNDPAGSYLVTEDINGVTGNILSSDRPFTGTIDFQGHSVTMTGFSHLFYRVSSGGVVKNLVLNYDAVATDATTYRSGIGTVAYTNYGTMQNIIVNYNPDNQGYGIDVRYAGGIVRYNYGTIDGFVVQLMKDVKVYDYFGGICQDNYGSLSNGYVCSRTIPGTTRSAQLIHVWKDDAGATLSTQTPNLSYGVGYNGPQGSLENVFILGNLVIQSAVADPVSNRADADYQTGNSDYETSTTNTNTAALLVGNNVGSVENAFTVGDRLDYDPVNNQFAYMLDRGPAIAYMQGQYTADNLTYFSFADDPYSQHTSADSTIGSYNRQGEFKSLYDYQWYESALREDGARFNIRDNVDEGYYPQLILPDSFPANAQPHIELPSATVGTVQVLANEVRQQGVNQALVTVTLHFPYAENAQVTDFTLVDRLNQSIDCTVVAQRAVEDNYYVDILLSLPEDDSAQADSSYTITGVEWSSGSQTFNGTAGERQVAASFWQEISTTAEWKTLMVSPTPYIYGNYLLTKDLDFSKSTTYADWYCSRRFYGALNGGIYSTRDVTVTDSAGNEILSGGQAMTMTVWDTLTGMHTISGVGNVDADGKWASGRDSTYRGGLMEALYGTMENLVFSNFNTVDTGTRDTSINSAYSGVVMYAREGALLKNCHVRNSSFFSRNYAAGLVGNLSGTTVENCSARLVEVNTYRAENGTETVNVGGLVGYASSSIITGCFTADITVLASDVYAAAGIGGLVGTATGTIVQDCYATGTINAGAGRVGGIAGQLAGSSELTGCWSTASVQTVSDFAGGIVGYHADGVLTNNYTASTIITRSFAASSVHRICSSTDYSEEKRHDNYAFEDQYLTYTDLTVDATKDSIYQFGVWSELDGATALLSTNELENAGVWRNRIGVGAHFDLDGTGKLIGASGSTTISGVSDGIMPKLVDADTGALVYDQPDVAVGKVNDSVLSRVYVSPANTTAETFTVRLVLYSDAYENIGAYSDFSKIADWKNMSVNGGVIVGQDDAAKNYGITDQGAYPDAHGNVGRAFSFTVQYGEQAGNKGLGHYLDSYILSLTVNQPAGGTEALQVRVSLSEPVYKMIYTIDQWDKFFSDKNYANSFENVMIASSDGGSVSLDFGGVDSSGTHQRNVKVNRLSGAVSSVDKTYPTLKNFNMTFTTNGQSLVGQVMSEISNLNFENMTLESGAAYGGDGKGVIGWCQGNLKSVSFKNITVNGGTSSSVGCVGVLYGTASEVTMENITVSTKNSNAGGLVGYAYPTSTVTGVTMTGSGGVRNSVTSLVGNYAGGIIGLQAGIASDLSVRDLDVMGRYCVGGISGILSTDAGRPAEYKLQNVTVGNADADYDQPGVQLVNDQTTPSVTVKLWQSGGTTTSTHQYAGGAVGYGGGFAMRDLVVYNTAVVIPQKPDADTTDDGTYAYRIGGVVGSSSGNLTDSLAKHVTVASYGGWCGGVSSDSVGQYNTAESCLVYATSEKAQYVGGVVGYGGVSRAVAKSCAVIGVTATGGVVGYQTSDLRECGAVDCVVIGSEAVGGLAGWDTYYHNYDNYVTASADERGAATASMTISAELFAYGSTGSNRNPLLAKAAGSYTGTQVGLKNDSSNVGGLVGRFTGVYIRDSYVSAGVSVQGTQNVGGLVGVFYGWYANSSWLTTSRYLYNCASGATVQGAVNVGGMLGCYTRSDTGTPGSAITTADHPNSNFYGWLVTGSVSGSSNAHFLVGSYEKNQIDNGVDQYLTYGRVYDGATVNGVAVSDEYGSYDAVKAIPVVKDRTDYAKVLTVTADNLADPNLYFLGRNTTYGGMGWSRSTWSDDAMETLYVPASAPSSTATYQAGIVKTGLVLWLDARNNTGEGYTDENSGTWTDLSGSHNDATLYWNGKTGSESLSFAERTSIMRWNNGALEFDDSSNFYYAELEQSLSPYLQKNYTVELIYTYVSPSYSGYNSVLSWMDGGVYGGFRGSYNTNYGTAAMYTNTNTAGTSNVNISWSTNKSLSTDERVAAVSGSFARTASFVIGETEKSLNYYVNGASAVTDTNTGSSANVAFRDSADISWRIGRGADGVGMMRVCGVRVYDRALSPEQVAQNAAYDSWYYFGGDQPAEATDTSAVYTLDTNGTASASGLTLIRSEDGTYNGTLVTKNFQSGTKLGSRGYYYLIDGNGHYSNIVAHSGPGYGPLLRTISLNSEYYGATKNLLVRGQEGQSAGGMLHSTDDSFFYGGFSLPQANLLERTMQPTATPMMLSMMGGYELIAYASGVDTVNLELDSTPEEAFAYSVRTDDGVVLEGTWPAGRRTLTMTWDFNTNFAVEVDGEEYIFVCSELCRTVMTYGDKYWYLYGGQCYGKDKEAYQENETFVHMMEGKLLDKNGYIWYINDIKSDKPVTAFELCTPQPLWSGTVNGAQVESFGSYLVTPQTTQETQLVVRGNRVYTMPGADVSVGSFVVDSYGDKLFTAVLTIGGSMVDMGDALTYPTEFSRSGIRELSCSLGYSGHMALVRYWSGKLVAFNYLTGEEDEVLSEEATTSFLDYLWDSVMGGDSTLLGSGSQQNLGAAAYEDEVTSNPDLQAALSTLTNGSNTLNGSGSGVDVDGMPGGQDAQTAGGSVQDSGVPSVADGSQTVTEGEGPADETEETALDATDPAGVTETTHAGKTTSTDKTTDSAGETEGDDSDRQTSDDGENIAQTEETGGSVSGGQEQAVFTQYVTLYNPKTGETAVYQLDELLTTPAEELVSQEERAEELEELGFQTSLLNKQKPTKAEASGFVLLALTALATGALLICMSTLKKRKLDRP